MEELDLKDTVNSVAFKALDQYATEGILSAENVKIHKENYTKLHQMVTAGYQRQKELMKRAKTLNNDLLSEKIKLEKQTIRKSEEVANTNNLLKEKEKALKEVTDCTERDSVLTFEMAELQREHMELLKQRDEMVQENADQVEPQIRQITQETSDIGEEVNRTEAAIKADIARRDEYAQKIDALTQQRCSMENEVQGLRRELNKHKSDPERARKQADVIEKAVNNLENEVEKLQHKVDQYETAVEYQKEKHDEADELQHELDHKLSVHHEAIEHHQRDIAQEKANLEAEKMEYHALVSRKLELEMQLKESEQKSRRENEQLNGATKEFDRLKKLLKKKQMLSDGAKSLLPNLKSQVIDTEQEVELFKADNKHLKVKQGELKQDVEIFIAKYLKQEGIEKSKREELIVLTAEVKELELELSQWVTEETKQNRIISMLSSQREIKAREASNAAQSERETAQEVRMKELVILDLAKKCNETSNRLKEFSALYDVVKNERNKYVNLIQSSSQALAEMKEKIKILQNEVEVLRNESTAKDKALAKEKLAHQASQGTRDGLRLDTNKAQVKYRAKQAQVEQQIVEIEKLNSIINTMEKDMLRLKKKYEIGVDGRNFTGVQLIDRNDELCILYEKSNIQEATLKKGEMSIREKEQAIRMLNIQINEQKRGIEVARKAMPVVPELAKKVLDLQKDLNVEKEMVEMLCKDLETPKNADRWRALGGEDPDEEQLAATIQVLEERLNTKKEQLLEKELVLEEVTNLADKLRAQASEGREDTLRISKRVNDFQVQIKEMTRKMMATVSELSMMQATAMKLQQDKNDRKKELEEATWNFEQGRCPSDAIEREWDRREHERLRREETKYQSETRKAVLPTKVPNTTAEPRPNAYIPSDLGIPKPYGGQAPFKPSEKGSTMRHIRKPEEKDIEI